MVGNPFPLESIALHGPCKDSFRNRFPVTVGWICIDKRPALYFTSGSSANRKLSTNGLLERNPVGVGNRRWVILRVSCRQISDKFFRMMVARDGVEPPTPAFSGLRSTT